MPGRVLQPQPVGVVERLTVSAKPGDGPVGGDVVERFLGRAGAAGAEVALLGYHRASPDGYVPSRLTGPTLPAALRLSRARFPSLGEDEARRLGGPGARLDEEALRVTWSLSPSLDGQQQSGESNPAVQLVSLLDGVRHHDSHRHAAAPGG